jgi:hypothetical protein
MGQKKHLLEKGVAKIQPDGGIGLDLSASLEFQRHTIVNL